MLPFSVRLESSCSKLHMSRRELLVGVSAHQADKPLSELWLPGSFSVTRLPLGFLLKHVMPPLGFSRYDCLEDSPLASPVLHCFPLRPGVATDRSIWSWRSVAATALMAAAAFVALTGAEHRELRKRELVIQVLLHFQALSRQT